MCLRQKAQRNSLVRNVTLNVVKEVIGVDIYPHGSIKYEQIRMILRQKMPNNIIVIVAKSTNMHIHFGITRRIAKRKGITVSSKLKLIHLVNHLMKENTDLKKMIM
jgi:hypothetical protein